MIRERDFYMNNKLNDKVKKCINNIETYSQMSQKFFENEMEDLSTALDTKSAEDIAFYLASEAKRKTLDSLKRREEKKLKQLKMDLVATILD